ncbi:PhnD/SsuA/transferrin family substrate-binding protein [Nonomuraea phyllanthi]|uniref:PhnD/SsuA/transferrin family substrate-binding protein n=1 Tax=Nonomuraea phyllanthi TaxID=2219224 RepID=A0A5C4W472_9ACTN|nr:ABC transporter substrate-binding protein [Nonomuraea phyllanthi]KAB8191517.1 PhnD/SsuA/transferrin family substrate-binding protein [Nonomuraea phyllanthi]QFY13156.1 PhnD/SsuA/transferrin family substrate-binding protein [Nonomuraea phyllanthi]
MSRLRLAAVAAATVSLALGLTACGGDTTSAGASGSSGGDGATITYGIYEPGADSGYLLMGKEKDFFAKHGVKVEIVQLKSAQQAFPALLAKQVDIIQGNPSEALLAVQKGAKLKFVGSTMPGQNYALYAKNDVASVQAMSGATLGVSTPTGLPAVVAKAMMLQSSVDPSSVKLVNSGGSSDRYKAVVAGQIQAASAPLDYTAQAAKDGVKVLARAKDVVPDFPRYALITRDDVLQSKGQAVSGLIAGLVEGIRYANDHPDEAKALAAKTLKLPATDPMIEETYKEFHDGGYLALNGEIPVKQIKYLADLQVKLGITDKAVPVDPMVDDSYRQKAVEGLGQVTSNYYGDAK